MQIYIKKDNEHYLQNAENYNQEYEDNSGPVNNNRVDHRIILMNVSSRRQ